MKELLGDEKNIIHILKGLIKGFSVDLDPNEMGHRFKEILKDVSQDNISKAIDELTIEGMNPEDIEVSSRKLAEMIGMFKEDAHIPPAGHPVHILMIEHRRLLEFAFELEKTIALLERAGSFDAAKKILNQMGEVAGHLKGMSSHYLREENVLFPYLEKHGIVGPAKVMWMEHDLVRDIEKQLFAILDSPEKLEYMHFISSAEKVAGDLLELFNTHFTKENTILYTAALRAFDDMEWIEIRNQFDEIGYPEFTPKDALIPLSGQIELERDYPAEGGIVFDTGQFTGVQIESMLNTLPFDITFIDDTDEVRFFNQPKDPIFTRMKAILGTKVQNCHPSKSVHLVDKIIGDFRNGERDDVSFWINMGGKLIYIRYLAVRDKQNNYLGCMEVSQDITEIQKLEGENHLI